MFMGEGRIKIKQDLVKFQRLALTTGIMVYLAIVMGGVVRSSGTEGCPDWPTCYGQWLPPSQPGALLDYGHRLGTLLILPLIVLTFIAAWRNFQDIRWIRYAALSALIVMGIQVVWGGLVSVQAPVDRSMLTAVHLGVALLLLAFLLVLIVAAFYQRAGKPTRQLNLFRPRSRFHRLTLLSTVAVFLVLVSGAVVSAAGLDQACGGWPLCGRLLPATGGELIHIIHRGFVLLTGILVFWMLLHAWKTQRTQVPVLTAATVTASLFFAQALMGAYKVAQGFPAHLIGLHEATAAAVWASVVIQLAAVGMVNRSAEVEQAEPALFAGRKGLLKDYLMLTKPIVVALLLVTTFAGMVIGAKEWPSLYLVFWTLLGGFMAAGGSGAINQYIDRFDDTKMQRTEKRPIPSGRLTPGEGLAFGAGMAILSFYLVIAFVNFLAALLVLAGIIYYVLIYSIFLKKTTVQNIVIGGGAGAIPPLVGWAAATGSLNIPSLFLFAVVFMWTPPHFWALALVRKKDYARAGVPMLPVIKGEAETRWQIFIYTVELVALTLLLPLFGLGGSFYLVSAVVLGGALLASAWRVWRKGGNKLAWKMYRHSSMYLAFIFLALMVDALL
jgi:heme o synthase